MSAESSAVTREAIRRIGRFTILADLAKGGMAQVYVALKDGSSQICVLKQLLGELGTHATAGRRFYREAQVASYLSHPRIARTVDAGFEDGVFCIAVEFISGKDVESVVHHLMARKMRLPLEASIAIAADALEGLSYAHDAVAPDGSPLNLVHRDLSPRNLMIGFDGAVRIIDFGLARGTIDSFKTAPGTVLGTLRYISPEQAMAESVDRRSDLYSLGVILHEMLTGEPLVPDGSALEVLSAVVQETAPRISSVNSRVSPELDEVVARALAKDPKDRWQTADEFRRALLDAAGPDAKVARDRLGDMVANIFPDDQARARELVAMGERIFLDERRGEQTFAQEQTRAAARPSSADRGPRPPSAFEGRGGRHTPPAAPVATSLSELPAQSNHALDASYAPTMVEDPFGSRTEGLYDTRTDVQLPTAVIDPAERLPPTRVLGLRGGAPVAPEVPASASRSLQGQMGIGWLLGVAIATFALGAMVTAAVGMSQGWFPNLARPSAPVVTIIPGDALSTAPPPLPISTPARVKDAPRPSTLQAQVQNLLDAEGTGAVQKIVDLLQQKIDRLPDVGQRERLTEGLKAAERSGRGEEFQRVAESIDRISGS